VLADVPDLLPGARCSSFPHHRGRGYVSFSAASQRRPFFSTTLIHSPTSSKRRLSDRERYLTANYSCS
jgi:hypothetical protein